MCAFCRQGAHLKLYAFTQLWGAGGGRGAMSALIKDHFEMCRVFLLPQQDDSEEKEEKDTSVSPGSKTEGTQRCSSKSLKIKLRRGFELQICFIY